MRVKLWTLSHTGTNRSPIHIQERICYTVLALHSFHRCLNIGQPSHMVVFLDRESMMFPFTKQSSTKHLHLVYEHVNKKAVPLSDIFRFPHENVAMILIWKYPDYHQLQDFSSDAGGRCYQLLFICIMREDAPVTRWHFLSESFGHQWKTRRHERFTETGSALCSQWWPPFFILRFHMWLRYTPGQLYSQLLFSSRRRHAHVEACLWNTGEGVSWWAGTGAVCLHGLCIILLGVLFLVSLLHKLHSRSSQIDVSERTKWWKSKKLRVRMTLSKVGKL